MSREPDTGAHDALDASEGMAGSVIWYGALIGAAFALGWYFVDWLLKEDE